MPFPSPMRESESEVAQSCPTLSDPMDCSPPASSIHGIFQARVLEWGAIAFSAIQVHRGAKHSSILFEGSTRVWPIYKDKKRSERQKIPDIIYSGQMGSCQDASRGPMGVSEDCLLNWELFELFCFLYFTYF